MTRDFTDLIRPVVGRVIEFLRGEQDGRSPGLKAFRDEMIRLIDLARREGSRLDATPLGLRALTYWVDEMVIDAHWWPHAKDWKEIILEDHYYGTRRAAVEFYNIAREAREQGLDDALEVCLLCVALGFRGMRTDDADRAAWVKNQFGALRKRRHHRSGPHRRPTEDVIEDDLGTDHDPDSPGLTPLTGPRWVLAGAILWAFTLTMTLLGMMAAIPARV